MGTCYCAIGQEKERTKFERRLRSNRKQSGESRCCVVLVLLGLCGRPWGSEALFDDAVMGVAPRDLFLGSNVKSWPYG